MADADLTETTVRWLFSTSWLPSHPGERTVAVPGGSTTAVDTGASLLHIALWNLRGQGLMEFEQLRPVARERVRVMGGKPFSAFAPRDPEARSRGLEGALLDAARRVGDDRSVRSLVRALDLDERGPWNTVCGHCFAEAAAAGLVETKGRLFKKVAIRDPAAVEPLRARNDELREARGAYLDAEPELTGAVNADCLTVMVDAFQPGLGD